MLQPRRSGKQQQPKKRTWRNTYIQTMNKLIKAMIETTLLQKNVNMTITEGLLKLQEEVISPESEMTPNGKKLKEFARRNEEEDPLGLHSFAFQTITLGRLYYQGKKRRKETKGKNPRYGDENENYGEAR